MESEQTILNLKSSLNNAFNNANSNTRKALANILKEKIFTPIYDISLREMKALAQERLKKVMTTKVVSVKDFLTDPENIFTTHEMLGYCDASLATKFTVQFNLFGGTIVGLGTKEHEKLFDNIDSLKMMGCFCLTELGYGNNAVEMETTAVWNDVEGVFVITTPSVLSQKYWITNGAYYANWAVVFAQTIVKNKAEGINAFLVQIRDDKMSPCQGVVIDDMGCKQGMNGVDNARIILKSVKVPRANLLNKLADISSDGVFESKIANRRQRFLAASNRLLSGRLCIASMSIAGTKLALLVTCKYATTRLSNGKTGKSDTPVSKFGLFAVSIVPLIARTVVLNIGLLHIRQIYSNFLINADKYTPSQFNEVVRLVCAIKPLVAWNANQTGNTCRERCGGMGFLSINRIEELIPFAHASITAEGDSAVLIHKVAKEYVDDFNKNLIAIGKPQFDVKQLGEMNDITNLDVLFSLIKHREILLLQELAEKTSRNTSGIYDLWMLNESDLIQDLGKTFGERVCLEESIKKFAGTNTILENLIAVFAANYVQNNLAWYLNQNIIKKQAAQHLVLHIRDLTRNLGQHALSICEGFGIPEHLIHAPIYTGYQKYYNVDQTNGEHYSIWGNARPKF